MEKNVEIEFKTMITKEKYDELLKAFNLENNIFKQVNHYFDTDDLTLMKHSTVLRIRQKGPHRFKVTLKCQGDTESYENHVILNEAQALHMIENGFNTGEFFDVIDDIFVTFKVSLDNYRVSTPYENGVLFLDRCDYCDKTDYELEFEVGNYEEGKIVFDRFLQAQNITFKPTKRKSERAFTCKR